MEVASLKLGDRIEAEWLPLLGISYDPKNDLIDIALEGVDHMIHHPREIYVAESGWSYPASRLSMRKARARSSFSEIR